MKSPYITQEGWNNLKKELTFLWEKERPIVTKAVSDAAALGDRSENAEYLYGKKRLREIDRRVRFLRKRLNLLRIVNYHPAQEGKVFFGAWIEIFDKKKKQRKTLRIVGSDEFDPQKNWISVDSPVARALVGKTVNDEISLNTPGGRITLTINKIWYNNAIIKD